jgi:hypothetical protein
MAHLNGPIHDADFHIAVVDSAQNEHQSHEEEACKRFVKQHEQQATSLKISLPT